MLDRRGELHPNENHLQRLKNGVVPWNQWRTAEPFISPDLKGADLHGVDLHNVNFANTQLMEVNLRNANLKGAILFQVELCRADLSGASLERSDMRGAKLHQADLSGVTLRQSNLFRADFIQTRLEGTDFSGAYLHTTALSQVDLSKARGLASVVHGGMSSVDIPTLLLSGNAIPKSFLTGTGIPEEVVKKLLDSTQNTGVEGRACSCFISYGGQDEAFARKLFKELKSAGVKTWFAPEDLAGGKKIFEQLDAAIRVHDRLILVLSQHSLKSQWVATEIARAKAREVTDKRRVLFPIRLISYDSLANWKTI